MVVQVITMVPSLIPKDEVEQRASPQLAELREALKKYGGTAVLPILLGDATVVASKALDPAVGPFDALITRHNNIKAYNLATRSDMYQQVAKNISKIITFGFSNSPVKVRWVLPTLKTIFKRLKDPVDSKTKAASHMQVHMYQATGSSGLENYKAHIANHPGKKVFLISLNTNYDGPQGKAAENEFTKGWYRAAFSDDVNITLQGPLVSLDDGPKMFQGVSITEFPSREVFVQWLESDYHTKLHEKREAAVLDKFDLLCLPVYG
jgi:hypothetical protein